MDVADELRNQACDTLMEIYSDMAAAEALTRAMIKERAGEREEAQMWCDVYVRICRYEEGIPAEIVRI
jgi:hypothetical protein